jgi:hypothetical protein
MSGELLGRLSGRFWVTTSPAADPAGEEGASPPAAGVSQGASPFFPSSISPSPNHSLSSSAESRCLKQWQKKCSPIDLSRLRVDPSPQIMGCGNTDFVSDESTAACLHRELVWHQNADAGTDDVRGACNSRKRMDPRPSACWNYALEEIIKMLLL